MVYSFKISNLSVRQFWPKVDQSIWTRRIIFTHLAAPIRFQRQNSKIRSHQSAPENTSPTLCSGTVHTSEFVDCYGYVYSNTRHLIVHFSFSESPRRYNTSNNRSNKAYYCFQTNITNLITLYVYIHSRHLRGTWKCLLSAPGARAPLRPGVNKLQRSVCLFIIIICKSRRVSVFVFPILAIESEII